MNDELSILGTEQEPDLRLRKSDVATAFIKGLVGAAPLVGPLLAEAVGTVIPDQKLDRIIAFAKVLNDRIGYLEQETLKAKARSEEFNDLLEDGLTQASRALTPDRRSYIASLLVNSISTEDLSHVERKKLMWLLGELNDAEILTLKYHSLLPNERRAFAQVHKELFEPIHRSLGAPQENVDKGAMRDSFRNRLLELGLLEPEYKRTAKGQVPEFDERTGRVKATGLKVTALGKLLLRSVDEPLDGEVSEKGRD